MPPTPQACEGCTHDHMGPGGCLKITSVAGSPTRSPSPPSHALHSPPTPVHLAGSPTKFPSPTPPTTQRPTEKCIY